MAILLPVGLALYLAAAITVCVALLDSTAPGKHAAGRHRA